MAKLNKSSYLEWAHSDLLSNAERGVVAEFLVSKATSSLSDGRVEWDAIDVTTPQGIKIEVKASGYLQSWQQTKPSTIRFGIEKTIGWDAKTNKTDDTKSRSSDVYVFCIHMETNRELADPLETDQWTFLVISTDRLNNMLGDQKSIGLSTLGKIGAIKTSFEGLAHTIFEANQK